MEERLRWGVQARSLLGVFAEWDLIAAFVHPNAAFSHADRCRCNNEFSYRVVECIDGVWTPMPWDIRDKGVLEDYPGR